MAARVTAAHDKPAWGSISLFAGAHFLNDLGAAFLPQLAVVLIASGTISVSAAAVLVAAYTVSSSFFQPVFGYIVDRSGYSRIVFFGTLWMGVFLGLTGVVSSYALLLVFAVLGGLGAAAFHPQAASLVGRLGGQRKGTALATFVAVGNFGMAGSSLLFLPLLTRFGTRWSLLMVGIGALGTFLLMRYKPAAPRSRADVPRLSDSFPALRAALPRLSALMVVVTLRSTTQTGLTVLLPLYLLGKGFSPEVTGVLVFASLAAGAGGGLIGGHLSDGWGRKPVVVGSLLLSGALFYAFLMTQGAISFVLLALGGMALFASFSVTVAMSQEAIPDHQATASGLSLGFAIGMGGLAVTPLGHYADIAGVEAAIRLAFMFPLAAGLIALALPTSFAMALPVALRKAA